MTHAKYISIVMLLAISCAKSSGESNLNFTSVNLQNFNSLYDLQLKPRPLSPSSKLSSRSLTLNQSVYELRYFKIEYAKSDDAAHNYEGDIKNMKEIAGTGLPKDKMLDKVIPITTLVSLDYKIELPEGHYAAVICPRTFGLAAQCLTDAAPLNEYKEQVQEDRCGRITEEGESIHNRCKELLFKGKNTFLAIAYPLTVKRVDNNNRFVAGDLDLAYIPAPEKAGLNLLTAEASEACQEAMKKATEEGFDAKIIEDACPNNGIGATAGASPGSANGGDPTDNPTAISGNNRESSPNALSGRVGNQLGNFVSNAARRGPGGRPKPDGFQFPPMLAGGFGGGDCFAAGTKIMGVKKAQFRGPSSDFGTIPIESFETGDYVFNPMTQELVPVTSTISENLPAGKSIYRLAQAGIQVTGVHPVLVPQGLTFVGNFFNSLQGKSTQTQLLHMMGTNLQFQQETIERIETSAPFTVYNVKTDPSRAVPTSNHMINRSMLPGAFACTGAYKQACDNFVAVQTKMGIYLVAGELVKQEILGDVLRGFSSASYQGAAGKIK